MKRIHQQTPAFANNPATASAGSSPSNSDNKKLMIRCTKCPAIIGSQRDYESHMGLHGSLKKFKCRFCDYAVSRVDYLRKHELVHQPQRQRFRQYTRPASLGAGRVSSPVTVRRDKRQSGSIFTRFTRILSLDNNIYS